MKKLLKNKKSRVMFKVMLYYSEGGNNCNCGI
jgi:hypothetical protein